MSPLISPFPREGGKLEQVEPVAGMARESFGGIGVRNQPGAVRAKEKAGWR